MLGASPLSKCILWWINLASPPAIPIDAYCQSTQYYWLSTEGSKSELKSGTVPLLKSCHRRRRLFLITGGRHILHELGDHYSLFHQPPIKIFLLYAQKGGQMRQSNLPPFFSRRWSAAYWAEIWPADAASILTSISHLSNSYLSVWFSPYFLVYMHLWLFWPT